MRDLLNPTTKIRNIMTESFTSKCYRYLLAAMYACKTWLMLPFTSEQ